MTRAVFQELLLFVLPFVAFAIYLIVRRRNPLAWSSWSDQSIWLVIAGLAIVIVSLISLGLNSAWIAILTGPMGLSPAWPILPMLFVTPAVTFVLNRQWVFA